VTSISAVGVSWTLNAEDDDILLGAPAGSVIWLSASVSTMM
jgi:hypothetical protein